jgi:hypothetical protein
VTAEKRDERIAEMKAVALRAGTATCGAHPFDVSCRACINARMTEFTDGVKRKFLKLFGKGVE